MIIGASETMMGANETIIGASEMMMGASETIIGASETIRGASEREIAAYEKCPDPRVFFARCYFHLTRFYYYFAHSLSCSSRSPSSPSLANGW